MTAFDQLWIWNDPAVRKRLGWYREVAGNRKAAKFRIAAAVPAAVAIDEAPEADPWDEFGRLVPVFLGRLERVRGGGAGPDPRRDRRRPRLCRRTGRHLRRHDP